MLRLRLTQGLGAILACGAAYAAISPLVRSQEPMKPEQQHSRVLKGVGDWEGQMIMSIPGSDETMSMPCSESIQAVGQFWTVGKFTGNFGGMEFVGMSQLGYDPKKEQFIGTWLDNQNPYMANMEGEWDAKKNAIVMHYDMFDTMSGDMLKMRNETVHTDGAYTITFYQLSDGDESEMMRMEMKKVPGDAMKGAKEKGGMQDAKKEDHR